MTGKPKKIVVNVSDSISISESISIESESTYLITSNRKKVSDLLCNSPIDQNNIIDILIGLHLILEVGINGLFRQLIGPTIKKDVPWHEVAENLDKINFIDKTVMFIYYSKFDFSDLNKATHYHKVMGKLKNFSEMRNKLLHGHAISSRFENGVNSQSNLKKNLNLTKLQEQLNNFRFILEGMSFFIDSLPPNWSSTGKEHLKKTYLEYSFLPHTSFSSE